MHWLPSIGLCCVAEGDKERKGKKGGGRRCGATVFETQVDAQAIELQTAAAAPVSRSVGCHCLWKAETVFAIIFVVVVISRIITKLGLHS